MSSRAYIDFDLQIARAAQGYRAEVSSPFGRASHAFVLPFSDIELENFVLKIGAPRRGVRGAGSPEAELARAFGQKLFDAVFDDELRACLRTSLSEASRQEQGLRLRLRLDDAPDLVDVPWEFLYDQSLSRFLALSVETPLVRYLDTPERIRPLAVSPPLRVLVVIASPRDLAPLDVEQEWARLQGALADLTGRGLVVLERLPTATLAGLQRALRQGEHNILHFIGHGGFDTRAEDGYLVLEDAEQMSYRVGGHDLGMLLHDHRPLRLALLNACEGGRAADGDLFGGVAQRLVQQGLPAVIAMQFEVSDAAAITLAHEFYTAIADGYPVDAALAEARRAVYFGGQAVEWGTPVLYMRAPDGKIFDVAPQASPAAPIAPPVQPTAPAAAEHVGLVAPDLTGALPEAGTPPPTAQPSLLRQALRPFRLVLWAASALITLVLVVVTFGVLREQLGGTDVSPTPLPSVPPPPPTPTALVTPTAAPTAAPAPAGRVFFVAPDGLGFSVMGLDGSAPELLYTRDPSIFEGQTVNKITSLSADPTGTYLLYGSEGGGSGLTFYDIYRDGESRSVGEFVHPPRWSPDGKRLVGVTSEGSVEILDAARRQKRSLGGVIATHAAWAPDGQLLLADEANGVFSRYDPTSGDITPLVTLPFAPEAPWIFGEIAVLPDNKTIIFIGARQGEFGPHGEGFHWWSVAPGDEAPQPFRSNDPGMTGASDYAPSPDGARIAYIEYFSAGACADIPSLVVSASGRDDAESVALPLPGHDPSNGRYVNVRGLSWSPDGSRLIYSVRRASGCSGDAEGTPVIYAISADGTGRPQRIGEGILPVWVR